MEGDLPVHVLRELRDEIKQTRVELRDEIKQTRDELKQTRDELNARVERVERRQTESELRISSELLAVAGAVHELRDELREDRRLRATVDDHEHRIGALEKARGPTKH